MVRPVLAKHKVTSGWGPRVLNGATQHHNGIDYISESGNRTVQAMAAGVVVYDQDNYDDTLRWTDPKHSAGNMIIIKSNIAGQDYYIRYLHLASNFVTINTAVTEGQAIGVYGDVGYSFGAHVHIDFFTMSWQNIDPTQLILANLTGG